MKRTIALLATLLLSFGLGYADMPTKNMDIGNTVGATIYAPGATQDTIWSGLDASFDIYYENSDTIAGYSTGFRVWTTDGATWTWYEAFLERIFNGETMEWDTTWSIVTMQIPSRQYPPTSILDNGGLQVTLADINGAPADTIMWGGTRKNKGVRPGPLERQALMHFRAGGVSGSEVKTICIDSVKVGAAGDFVWADVGGSAFPPIALWPNGGRCYKVKIIPNLPPVITGVCPRSGGDKSHCLASVTAPFAATDGDGDTPLWRVVSHTGTGSASVLPLSGLSTTLTYVLGAGDAGNTVAVTVEVYDAFNAPGTGNTCVISFNITNQLPVADCGDDVAVGKGKEVVKSDFDKSDPDACDDDLTWFVFSGEGNFVGDVYHWDTDEGDTLNSPYTITAGLTDGFDTVYCDFIVAVLSVEPFEVVIETMEEPDTCLLQGHFHSVDIILNKGTLTIGGYDFLISYDATALTFMEATRGDLLIECEWEYFTYRYGPFGNCGSACPSGMVRIVAMAEVNDGAHTAECFMQPVPVTLATMKFLVTNDRTYQCQFTPINWYWLDCGDNTMSSETGDTLFVEQNVFDNDGDLVTPPSGYDLLPGIWGIDLADCIETYRQYPGKYPPLEFIDFVHGGIQICCADSIDARGDINLNGLKYEIADAVMFTNYFIEGLSAFRDHVEASIAASDVNADGVSLSVADLVYLIRVIIGDALPYLKPLPSSVMNLSAQMVNGDLVVNYDAANNVGAALLVFEVNGTIGTPVSNVDMDLKHSFNGSELRVLVYNIGTKAIPAGKDALLTIPVEGTANLVNAEVADYYGGAMEVSTRNLPSSFELNQNYPNPFNPTTTISLNLPVASDWAVSVYNVAGQMVRSYTGFSEAGTVNVVWDGTNEAGNSVASGIYFYKANASSFSATKKMLLMK